MARTRTKPPAMAMPERRGCNSPDQQLSAWFELNGVKKGAYKHPRCRFLNTLRLFLVGSARCLPVWTAKQN
jgi:hypothetical protein